MPNKVALITGASRGIGKACALHLAKAGYDIAFCARTEKEGTIFEHSSTIKKSDKRALPGSLETTVAELKALGRRALPITADLLKPADVQRIVATTLKEWGRIDVLMNNARYVGPGHMDPLMDTPMDEIRNHFQVNFFAAMELIKLTVPAMQKQGGGIIIQITAGSALVEPRAPIGKGGFGLAYATSKAATTRALPGLAKELRDYNIAVIGLEPGSVLTERIAQPGYLEEFGFSNRVPMEVPAAVCTYLVTHPYPMKFSGLAVQAPTFVVEHNLIDPATLPPSLGPDSWGLPPAR